MLIGWVNATEARARDLIAAIDAELGPTEVVRIPDGTLETRPRKTWARPIALVDGTWAVAFEERIRGVTHRPASPIDIPAADQAREVSQSERLNPEEP